MRIFEAQHNLPWVIEGAAVAVSIVCFAAERDRCAESSVLDGRAVRAIRSDLRDIDLPFDLRNLRSLAQNRRIAFQGVKLAGSRADNDDDHYEEERGFEVAKHRTFRWAPSDVLPSGSLVVFARSDDFFLGILESRFHKLWASETHNPLENRPRYRIGHSFESFPFPPGLTPGMPLADVMANPLAVTIADAARALYAARAAALTSGLQQLDMTELYDFATRAVPRG